MKKYMDGWNDKKMKKMMDRKKYMNKYMDGWKD